MITDKELEERIGKLEDNIKEIIRLLTSLYKDSINIKLYLLKNIN